jgi:hypothetical protein
MIVEKEEGGGGERGEGMKVKAVKERSEHTGLTAWL